MPARPEGPSTSTRFFRAYSIAEIGRLSTPAHHGASSRRRGAHRVRARRRHPGHGPPGKETLDASRDHRASRPRARLWAQTGSAGAAGPGSVPRPPDARGAWSTTHSRPRPFLKAAPLGVGADPTGRGNPGVEIFDALAYFNDRTKEKYARGPAGAILKPTGALCRVSSRDPRSRVSVPASPKSPGRVPDAFHRTPPDRCGQGAESTAIRAGRPSGNRHGSGAVKATGRAPYRDAEEQLRGVRTASSGTARSGWRALPVERAAVRSRGGHVVGRAANRATTSSAPHSSPERGRERTHVSCGAAGGRWCARGCW